jgi:3-isopropylmalate dehydrogenase
MVLLKNGTKPGARQIGAGPRTDGGLMSQDKSFTIGVLAGDGIGPEVTAATVATLEAACERTGLRIDLKHARVGWKALEKEGALLSEPTLEMLRASDGWIMGPTFAGEYPKTDDIKGHPSGYLRRTFKLFANVRPVKAFAPLNPIVPGLDVTIIRENTEGFYPDRNLAWGYGEFMPTEDVALSLRVITGVACDRFAKFCLDFAATQGIEVLHVAHKRTALPRTEGLFIGAFEKLAPDYPKVKLNLLRVDTFSSAFPSNHKDYRLVCTTNLFGDILSDQASGLAGGVGLASSLNAGASHAMAQAVHGTAPDIAGKGVANPAALILSTALMFDWLYQRSGVAAARETANCLRQGVETTILSGVLTPDLGGTAGTEAVTKAVIAAMGEKAYA